MNWFDIYYEKIRRVGSKKYYAKKIKHKKELISIIEEYSKNKSLVETGCGSGVLSIYFKNKGFDVIAIDNDEKMINLSKTICKELKYELPDYKKNDIKEIKFLPKNAVAFSNGVYEHFTNEEIQTITNKIMEFCDYNIISVPTNHFCKKEASFGNERFMSIKEWTEILKICNIKIVKIKTFDDRSFMQKLNLKKWFKPKPFAIFVISR